MIIMFHRQTAQWVLIVLLLLVPIPRCVTMVAADEPAKPTRERLLKVLKAALEKLERKELTEAAEHFVLPPDFKPSMLEGLLERREISKAGLEVLSAEATFGTAIDRFGEKRAKAFATKASVHVDDCYGFCHEENSITAEVIAVWKNSQFKLIRLDDVGKLSNK